MGTRVLMQVFLWAHMFYAGFLMGTRVLMQVFLWAHV